MIGSRTMSPRLAARTTLARRARVVALAFSAIFTVGATALLTGCPDKDDGKAAPAASPSGQTNTEAKPAASAKAGDKGGW